MKVSLFQGVLIGTFGLAAVIGIFVFATYTSNNSSDSAATTIGAVKIWGTLPQADVRSALATIALAEYLAFMLAVIKVVPVTLTASGIAGLIISVGMAVDANVLIFERTKEELRGLPGQGGKSPREAVHIGFSRAWTAIRDGHLTMIMSGIILFWLGTSIVQGFALVFVLGVLASFISAVTLSRVFLLAIVPDVRPGEEESRSWRFLLSSGIRKN